MELPRPDDDQSPPDHESRITKLEVRVQDLSVELKLLRQVVEDGFAAQNARIDALPGQILSVVRAELTEKLAAQNEAHILGNEEFRKAIEARLEVWRAENDRKLETWRKENDSKLEKWRKENDAKFEEWRREMRLWFRLIVGILVTAMVASFFT